jgi:hypothetical protein
VQHLLNSKDSFKRNYALEHQKQIRKYWKALPQDEKESLVVEHAESALTSIQGTNREDKRRQKILNLVRSLGTVKTDNVLEPEPNIRNKAIGYFKSLDDTTFIDSLLFPTLDQVSDEGRFCLHSLGRLVYKRVNDINFSKLVTQLEEKKVTETKSAKTTSKKKSSKKQSHKGSGHPTTPTDQEGVMESPEDATNQKKILALDEEMKLVAQEFTSGDGSDWFCSGTGSHSNRNKNRAKKPRPKTGKPFDSVIASKQFPQISVASGGGGASGSDCKAQSLHDAVFTDSEVKRTYSTSNHIQADDLYKTSNNRTLSTKTEDKLKPTQALTQQYSRPEVEVREEDDLSAEDTISRASNRGSVDHKNQNSSVDHKKNNLRTNSIERDVKKKLASSNNRLFKQLQKNSEVVPKKDSKQAQLVSLYSNHDIKEIMNNCEIKKIVRLARASAVNPSKPAESSCLDPETGKIPLLIELRKGSSHHKNEEASSPLAPKLVEKTPPSKKNTEGKKVFSNAVNKHQKWEDSAQDGSQLNQPSTLDFDGVEEALKPHINKGFQKYLSGPMTLEQGDLFFKNYLNYSINECVSKVKAVTKSYEPLRITAFKRIRNVITQTFKTIKSTLLIYGSWVTGLMIDSSDIDLCIKRYEVLERNEIRNLLETLENCFRHFKWVLEVKGIYTASVPVLKLVP